MYRKILSNLWKLLIILTISHANDINDDIGYCAVPNVGAADALLDELTAALHAAKCALVNETHWPTDPVASAHNFDAIKELNCDYVIVGAGTAGSIVASRLSEDATKHIILLEAGDIPPVESEIFTLSGVLQHNSLYAWTEYGVPSSNCCLAMRTPGACYYPRGKMLGGTGALNDNIFLRGSVANYDYWHNSGNIGWAWHDIASLWQRIQLPLNYFKTQNEATFEEQHQQQQLLSKLLLTATQQLGITNNLSDLRLNGINFGYTQQIPVSIEAGRRVSSARRYLTNEAAAQLRTNLHVIRNAYVTRVLLNADLRAIGVEYTVRERKGIKLRIYARKEVIISAGAINTPKLLMLSGIGPKQHLKHVGILPRVDLPVGENLHDHGMMPLLLKFGVEQNATRQQQQQAANNDAAAKYQSIFEYFLKRKGILAERFTLMGFINTTAPQYTELGTQPDLHLVSHTIMPRFSKSSFQFLGFAAKYVKAVDAALERNTLLQIMGSLLLPKSRGRVRLRSADAFATPLIYSAYGWHASDRAVLLRYVRYVQQLLRTTSLREHELKLLHLPIEECDRSDIVFDTDEYWLCYIRYFYISAWHFVGTCRMGPIEQPNTVVDARLRVKNVKALRVIDASIMPQITSGNTNGPTALIAEKGALMIKEDYQNQRL